MDFCRFGGGLGLHKFVSRLGQFRLIRNRCRRLLLSPFLPFVSHGGNNGDFPPLSSNPIYNVRSAAVGPIAEQKRGRWDVGVERTAAAKVRMLFAMLMMTTTPMSVMIPHISEYGNEEQSGCGGGANLFADAE